MNKIKSYPQTNNQKGKLQGGSILKESQALISIDSSFDLSKEDMGVYLKKKKINEFQKQKKIMKLIKNQNKSDQVYFVQRAESNNKRFLSPKQRLNNSKLFQILDQKGGIFNNVRRSSCVCRDCGQISDYQTISQNINPKFSSYHQIIKEKQTKILNIQKNLIKVGIFFRNIYRTQRQKFFIDQQQQLFQLSVEAMKEKSKQIKKLEKDLSNKLFNINSNKQNLLKKNSQNQKIQNNKNINQENQHNSIRNIASNETSSRMVRAFSTNSYLLNQHQYGNLQEQYLKNKNINVEYFKNLFDQKVQVDLQNQEMRQSGTKQRKSILESHPMTISKDAVLIYANEKKRKPNFNEIHENQINNNKKQLNFPYYRIPQPTKSINSLEAFLEKQKNQSNDTSAYNNQFQIRKYHQQHLKSVNKLEEPLFPNQFFNIDQHQPDFQISKQFLLNNEKNNISKSNNVGEPEAKSMIIQNYSIPRLKIRKCIQQLIPRSDFKGFLQSLMNQKQSNQQLQSHSEQTFNYDLSYNAGFNPYQNQSQQNLSLTQNSFTKNSNNLTVAQKQVFNKTLNRPISELNFTQISKINQISSKKIQTIPKIPQIKNNQQQIAKIQQRQRYNTFHD